MDLCLSRRKENRRIEVRAEGSAFVLGVFDAWHNRVVSVFMPPSAEPGMRRWKQIRQGIRERSGATASRAACDYGMTTAPTTSLMISRRAIPESFTTSTGLPAS